MSTPPATEATEAPDAIDATEATKGAGATGAARIDSLGYLFHRLRLLEARVRAAVAARRAVDPDPDDRFRGLYVSESQVDLLLAGPAPRVAVNPEVDAALATETAALEAAADGAETAGVDLRLRRLGRAFDLSPAEVDLLVVALAPDLDARFERLYAYLNDDVSRRRASIGLALELAGFTPEARAALHPTGRLCSGGLIAAEEPDAPVLGRPLRVPDRVIAHLLGDDRPEPPLAPLLAEAPGGGPWIDETTVGAIANVLATGSRLCYLSDATGSAAIAVAAAACRRLGLRPLVIDLTRLDPSDVAETVAAAAEREARLTGGALVAGPVETLVERSVRAVQAFSELGCTVVLSGHRSWDPRWSRQVPLVIEAPVLSRPSRSALWAAELDGELDGFDVDQALGQFRLSPEQMARAAQAARLQASAANASVGVHALQAGARAQNAAGLDRLARRIEPSARWADLVLPDVPLAQLRELAARARHRDRVLGDWGLGSPSRGRGVTGLFAGESGTGKTMAAEVIAAELGLNLYVVDLSTVIDKYVGETEKNLEAIFVEADRVNGVLLFDEADAIFGKRSEVNDAHDRYANVETAYLLQRMERFEGLAVLTTNLRANLDEAFTRRLDCVVDFPVPEVAERRRLWEIHLRRGVPLGEDIDTGFLATAFRIAGGTIRNAVVCAGFLAAAEGGSVGMAQLIRGVEREYRKLGHLCVPEEFGPYYPMIQAAATGLPATVVPKLRF